MKMIHLLLLMLLLSCNSPTSPSIKTSSVDSIAKNDIPISSGYSKMVILSSCLKNDRIINGTGMIIIKPEKKIHKGDCLEILMFIDHPGDTSIVQETQSNIHWIDHAGNLRVLLSLNFHSIAINKQSAIHTFLLNQ